MARACIGLGANLGDPAEQVERALVMLAGDPQIKLLQRSRLYRSKAVGPGPQPDYCNAACVVETELAPEALLQTLLKIEQGMGRRRAGQRWEPRLIDLDLLCYEQQVANIPGLRLPHPELHRRNFVLVPLAEIASDWNLPGLGSVRDLAQQTSREGLALWSVSHTTHCP